MSAYESLRPWEQHFVDIYVENAHAPNQTRALQMARPDVKRPDVTAVQVMKRPEIKEAIQERLTRVREQTDINEAWVLERLRIIAERCMQPLVNADGVRIKHVSDATNANKALELIGRHFGMWNDKVIAAQPMRVVEVVQFYDDEDDADGYADYAEDPGLRLEAPQAPAPSVAVSTARRQAC